jgi:hypothetical protein
VRHTTKEYYNLAFHAKLKGAEMIPLDEVLGVSSNSSSFDETTDQRLERLALQRLAERKAQHGR